MHSPKTGFIMHSPQPGFVMHSPQPGFMKPVTIALLLAIGVIGFIGTLLLGAYAPDLRSGDNGGGHALSNAATGFSGLVRLAEATGRHPRIVRNTHMLGTEDLVVATPESGAVPVGDIIDQRMAKPLLMVLPKWDTQADADHRGWVDYRALKDASDPEGVLAPATKLHIARRRSAGRPLVTTDPLMKGVAFVAPRPLQVITGSDILLARGGGGATIGHLRPLVTDGAGGIVVAQLDDRPFYILADPDLLTNRGMRDIRNAGSALAMLDYMNSNQPDGIAFDVTLNGFGHALSPLKLMFDPPFLAMTLTIVIVLLLTALQTVTRFGSARARPRAIAFGKTALVDNTALLVRKAGREAGLGARYVAVVRDAAVRAFGVPPRLHGAAIDAYLDRLDRPRAFTALARTAEGAKDRGAMLAAAQALHRWMGRSA